MVFVRKAVLSTKLKRLLCRQRKSRSIIPPFDDDSDVVAVVHVDAVDQVVAVVVAVSCALFQCSVVSS